MVLGGWARLVSPLVYQADRGLHIEAVFATPVMIARGISPGSWSVGLSPHLAVEITGPFVSTLLVLSLVAAALFLAGVLVIWWSAFRVRGSVVTDTVVWISLASATGLIVTGKVLSSQYLLWLLPPAAAAFVVIGATGSRRMVRWTVLLLVTARLTHLLFPTLYPSLLVHDGRTAMALTVLTVRNLLLDWLLLEACVNAWRAVQQQNRVRSGAATC